MLLRSVSKLSLVGRRLGCATTASRSLVTSPWADFAMAPPDPIIGLNEAFQRDDFPQKVIVGVGAYRDDAGKPYVLPCVEEAEKRLLDQNLVRLSLNNVALTGNVG